MRLEIRASLKGARVSGLKGGWFPQWNNAFFFSLGTFLFLSSFTLFFFLFSLKFSSS